MKKIVFLASGNGGNLKFFYLAQQFKWISDTDLIVIADRDCGSLKFARTIGLKSFLINYKRSKPFELQKLLSDIEPDAIVTNWHKIIDADTVNLHKGKLVNLHYSLLPAFGGMIGEEPIKAAYQQGCKFIGPTCHLVDEGVDTGKILAQAIFTTNRPIEIATRLMFRKGCLVLLSGIEQLVGDLLISKTNIEENDGFSPHLSYKESFFSDNFWEELSKL